jgi:hypothetical protein
LQQHLVGHLERVQHRRTFVAHLQQALVRDDDDRVDLFLQLRDPRLGLHRTPAAFEAERTGHDADRQRADLLGDLRDDGGATGSGTAALPRRDEHHVGALQHLFDLLAVLLGRLLADLGIGAGAEAAGEGAADVELDVGVGQQQRLGVGVDGDELDTLQARVDHAVDRVAPTAADSDDLDHREIVLRSAEHVTFFLLHRGSGPLVENSRAIRRSPAHDRHPWGKRTPDCEAQLEVDIYVNLCFASRLYRSVVVESIMVRSRHRPH